MLIQQGNRPTRDGSPTDQHRMRRVVNGRIPRKLSVVALINEVQAISLPTGRTS